MLLRLLLLVPFCLSSRILFIPEPDSASHIWSMMSFADGLRHAGHSITFLDFNTKPDLTVSYNEDIEVVHINATAPPEVIDPAGDPKWLKRQRGANMWRGFLEKEKLFEESSRLWSEKYDDLLARPWDLIVLDAMTNVHGFAIVDRMHARGVPYVAFFTSYVFYSHSLVNSFGRDPTSSLSMFVHPPTDDYKPYDGSNIFERLDQVYDYVMEYATMIRKVPYHLTTHVEWTGHPYSWYKLYMDASFKTSDSIDELGHPASESVSFISGGGYCTEPKMAQLTPDLLNFLENSTSQGTIYVAFGSMARLDLAPDRVKQAFEKALNQLSEYRIVLVYRGDDLLFGDHVRVEKWANQAAILRHSTTKVFLTHGGLKSLREGLCAEVPLVVLPVFAEQTHNARQAVERNIAVPLNKNTITDELIVSRVRQVASDESFKRRMIASKKLYLDHPMNEVERMVWWAERAIRRGTRALCFRMKGMEQGWMNFIYLHTILLFSVAVYTVST